MNNVQKSEIDIYIQNQEYIANNYVMKCFSVTMMVYTVTFVLNLLGIFIVEQSLMRNAFIPSMIIYFLVWIVTKKVSLSNSKMKYFILFNIILVFTITGVFLTYHAVLLSLLPFLYATLYSTKSATRYVYILTVISTIITVYGGYYLGLCDANMTLLTTTKMSDYVLDNQFLLNQVNDNPISSLLLFYALPRCFVYIAFMTVCDSLFRIVSGSLERAKLTVELEKAKDEAERANRAKTEFLAKVSHEIRTPINAVIGMNEMILRESGEEQIRKYASDVKDSSAVLLKMINEILDSAKIEAGMMELVCENYDIGSLLNDLYNMVNIKAKEKNLDLIFDIDSTIPCKYFGDDKRLRQILLNLLTNAVKYTNRGVVTLKVRCSIEDNQAILHYTVMDTGIGIRAEDIGKIYDAFQRFDVSRNRNVEGSGLGMNIVQQFLKLMGSELHIQSEYEKGSEFSFDLVQEIVNKEPLGDFRERILNTTEKKEDNIDYVAPEAKILVVDDSQMNRKVFKNLLKERQMQIFEAESGQECIEMVKLQSFDLVFLDHMMPELDGIETLHILREQELCPEVPVIMLTANAIVGDKEKYIEEGFHDFLSKPIIPYKLDCMILKYLSRGLVIYEKEENTVLTSEEKIEKLRMRLSEIDFESGIQTSCGNKDFYLEILGDFTELPIKEQLTRYLQEGDHKNYCIRIHGFKSSAYSIGAKQLGDLAYEMEKGSMNMFAEGIEALQESLFEQYDRICVQYKEL